MQEHHVVAGLEEAGPYQADQTGKALTRIDGIEQNSYDEETLDRMVGVIDEGPATYLDRFWATTARLPWDLLAIHLLYRETTKSESNAHVLASERD